MDVERRPAVIALMVLAAAALALFPLVGEPFFVGLVARTMTLAVFAMSLNLLVGFTGLVSLGHAAFFGLAGYTLVLFWDPYAAPNFWIAGAAAVATAAVAAAVIGALAIRTQGIFFIMVTLAFGEMLYYLFHDGQFAGGSDGAFIFFKPDAAIFGFEPFDLDDEVHYYYVAFAALAGSYLLLRLILGSLFGRVIVGIRENEHRMRSLGYPVYRYKLAAFVIAGAMAGLSGYLGVIQYSFVNPEMIGWHKSGETLMMVILGGMGSMFGSVIGTFTYVLLQEFLTEWTKHWLLPMGIFIVAVVLLLPNGLIGLLDFLKKPEKAPAARASAAGAEPAEAEKARHAL
jgi:branched-chain amino acid transport system permease protein